jgi:transglutaminase/protease-like cytokinesis protein 3
MDVYGTQLLIYDSIIDGCTYREDGTHAGTVYGALILGEARCEGYSKALCMALRAAGIESLILTGEAWSLEEGQAARPEKHAWNVAKLGDGYYQMDVTWDDPDGALPQGTCYAYFNLTDEAMYKKPHAGRDIRYMAAARL